MPFIRIAELQVDRAQLAAFTEIVAEEIRESVRVEPGVLAIYAVADREDPAQLRFFEIYTDAAAYESHRQSPHFLKYVTLTQPMIRTRKLIDAVPLQLSAKPLAM
ncbi:MAG: putative quinol monooxygenase [Tepidisphaeraceae bacterium]